MSLSFLSSSIRLPHHFLAAAFCLCGGLALAAYADGKDDTQDAGVQKEAQAAPELSPPLKAPSLQNAQDQKQPGERGQGPEVPFQEWKWPFQGPGALPYEDQYVVGVQLQTIPDGLRPRLNLEPGSGMLVASVLEGKPAALAGVRENDILLKVNGTPVDEPMEVVRLVNEAKSRPITLTLLRDANTFDVEVVPVKSSEIPPASSFPTAPFPTGGPSLGAFPPAVRIVGPGLLMNGQPVPGDPFQEIAQLKEQIKALQAESAELKRLVQELSKKLGN